MRISPRAAHDAGMAAPDRLAVSEGLLLSMTDARRVISVVARPVDAVDVDPSG